MWVCRDKWIYIGWFMDKYSVFSLSYLAFNQLGWFESITAHHQIPKKALHLQCFFFAAHFSDTNFAKCVFIDE